jgi:hypothetical protein
MEMALLQKWRNMTGYAGMFAVVQRLDEEGDRRSGPAWNHVTPVFDTFQALKHYVQARGGSGTYQVWLWHGWDTARRFPPVGVTTLMIPASQASHGPPV